MNPPKIVVVYRDETSHPQPLFDTLAKVQGEAFNRETLCW